jgi:hypothetical protein
LCGRQRAWPPARPLAEQWDAVESVPEVLAL